MECLYVCVFAPSPPGAEGPKTGLKAPKLGRRPQNKAEGPKTGQKAPILG